MIDRNKLVELIPWYLNNTLTGSDRDEVEDFIMNDPVGRAAFEEWRIVQQFMHKDEQRRLPAEVETRLFDRIRSKSYEQLEIFHPYAFGLSLVILILLWTIIRPGVTLHWNIKGLPATTFRIYRSNEDGSNYQLLDEVEVFPPTTEFKYVDMFIWPGQEYSYYVEGMNDANSFGTSQIVASPAYIALPGQLALICGSFFAGYGLILLIRYRKLLLIGNMHPTAT